MLGCLLAAIITWIMRSTSWGRMPLLSRLCAVGCSSAAILVSISTAEIETFSAATPNSAAPANTMHSLSAGSLGAERVLYHDLQGELTKEAERPCGTCCKASTCCPTQHVSPGDIL